jgi:hypothetical protein
MPEDELRDSPLHSRPASIHSDGNWNSTRPMMQEDTGPYQASEFGDSTGQLVHPNGSVLRYGDLAPSPTQHSFTSAASPTRQAFLQSPPGLPGLPGQQNFISAQPTHQYRDFSSPLAMPTFAAHRPDGRQTPPSLGYKEDFVQSSNASLHHPASDVAPAPQGPPGGPPPDGGLTAWLQVLGGYFLFFNTWGLINAFGTQFTSLSSNHS